MKFAPKVSQKASAGTNVFLTIFAVIGWVGCIGLAGFVFLEKSPSSNPTDTTQEVKVSNNQKFLEYNGGYWLKTEKRPVELKVLTDNTCGPRCDVSREIDGLKSNVSDQFYPRYIDISSPEGKSIIKKFSIDRIPQFIIGEGIESIKLPTGVGFLEAAQEVYIQKETDYLLTAEKIGLSPKRFLSLPAFTELDKEPGMQGQNAPITVVEFTDFECPFCQRLYNQTHKTIQKLVEDGKINYVIKDFPLEFHPNARFAHIAANKVLKEEGSQAYFDFIGKVFGSQKVWGSKSEEQTKEYFVKLAQQFGVTIKESTWNDGALNQELYGDIDEGRKYGVSGTPALLIGKDLISGAISASTLEQAVEKALQDQ